MSHKWRIRPDGYRTPSPPAWSPILSPVDASFHENTLTRPPTHIRNEKPIGHTSNTQGLPQDGRRYEHRPSGSMEAFASIALATQTNAHFWHAHKRPLSKDHVTDRAKRLRVESPRPKSYESLQGMPVTKTHLALDVRLQEANLLLHFSQQVRDIHHSPIHDRGTALPTVTRQRNAQETSSMSHQIGSDRRAIPSTPSVTLPPNQSELTDQKGAQPLSPLRSGSAQENSSIHTNSNDSYAMPEDDVVQLEQPEAPYVPDVFTTHPRTETDNTSIQDTNGHPSTKLQLARINSGQPQQPSSMHSVRTGELDMTIETSEVDKLANSSDVRLNHEESGTLAIAASSAQRHLKESSMIESDTKSRINTIKSPSIKSPDHPSSSNAICEACKFWKNSLNVDTETTATSWISCDGCKAWFHFACAGFKNEREVRSIDKYRCKKCKPIHGATTHVRKSARAHTSIDYAGLHQGVLKTSDDRPEHHYIQPIREGKISFLPEQFPRMRPELVTAEFFEKGNGMKQPIVIPAALNPRPHASSHYEPIWPDSSNPTCEKGIDSSVDLADWLAQGSETRSVNDHGQDALGMVMPQDLTVRKVAELYGPEEKVEVIDVKSQNGEGKKWNMRRWVDYYESSQGNKIIRNVISLEVSQSVLGRLVKRPQIVRDLDLQDSIWPEDLLAKGEYPHVQFYCLMSVADCFTDFHIDFGGSSVFYHILKGKKTFLFIPPKEKHLKKYEEWCMSPAQNWTFLPDQTHECYRVDLAEGDTMLIPSGWIHAVWTPEDSLVIGGNFLTRLNYGMQFRVSQVEKTTGVARKFRYPHFQKLHWFTVLAYLGDDPIPASVREYLENGFTFERPPISHEVFDEWGENSKPGPENYQARYYSQPELDGLPDLLRYILRTALIDNGIITEGISADTRNAVKRAIPRGRGEPLDIARTFALWCAWKRGNEPIPHWAYPNAEMETTAPDKLSATATRKLAEEAALKAPRRHSLRRQNQKEPKNSEMNGEAYQAESSTAAKGSMNNGYMQNNAQTDVDDGLPTPKKARHSISTGPQRKTACDTCRRRRRACKHKNDGELPSPTEKQEASASDMVHQEALLNRNALQEKLSSISGLFSSLTARSESNPAAISHSPSPQESPNSKLFDRASSEYSGEPSTTSTVNGTDPHADVVVENGSSPRPRTKACSHCRKSKVFSLSSSSVCTEPNFCQRRCIHDAFGNEDPIKVAETAIPRPHARKTHRSSDYVIKEDNTYSAIEHPHSARFLEYNALPMSEAEPNINLNTSTAAYRMAEVDAPLSASLQGLEQDSEQNENLMTTPLSTSHHGGSISVDSNPPQTRDQHTRLSFLASPPASAHEATDESPKLSEGIPSSSTSDIQIKAYQTYTPDSSSVRRTSPSSAEDRWGGKEKWTPSVQVKKARGLSLPTADEESMKLIKELQAQDLGLRRRFKP